MKKTAGGSPSGGWFLRVLGNVAIIALSLVGVNSARSEKEKPPGCLVLSGGKNHNHEESNNDCFNYKSHNQGIQTWASRVLMRCSTVPVPQ